MGHTSTFYVNGLSPKYKKAESDFLINMFYKNEKYIAQLHNLADLFYISTMRIDFCGILIAAN